MNPVIEKKADGKGLHTSKDTSILKVARGVSLTHKKERQFGARRQPLGATKLLQNTPIYIKESTIRGGRLK